MSKLLAPRKTVFLEPLPLRSRLGIEVTLATETFQYTGSFKYRAAQNLVAKVANNHVITASSGNFGQAISFACMLAGKRCTVVMPDNSAAVKVDAVSSYKAEVELVDTTRVPREVRVAELAAQFPDAYVASAFDDDFVIKGNSSLGLEIASTGVVYDAVVAPIGGGGLAAGLATGFAEAGYRTQLVGAEPLLGNDAARSLRAGSLEANEQEPQTLADGARTRSLGVRNWAILQSALAGIIEVSEAEIKESLQLLFLSANLKVEPTGALTVGALLNSPDEFRDQRVLCVVSGGNVDPLLYSELLG
ncbi:threonine/serine dehydratase [soil metagenome]